MNMAISMWNFHSWFQSRNISHICSIRNNNAQIIGVHLRSQQSPSFGYALLSEAPEYSAYRATLSFGEDHIYFHELTVMEVMDEINYMFTIYYYWQQGLKRINLARGSLKDLLALSYEIIPYPILVFRGNELMAYSPKFEEQAMELWNHFSSMSLNETRNCMKRDSSEQSVFEGPNPSMIYSQLFYGRQMIISNIRSSNGQYVRIAVFAKNGQTLSLGHIQIMKELTKAIQCNLTIWNERTAGSTVNPTDFFLSCVSKEYDENTVSTVLYRLGWHRHDRFTVFRFEPANKMYSILSDKLCQLLKQRFPCFYYIVDEYTVQMICNLEQSEDIPSKDFILRELPDDCFVVSQSNISSDFFLIPQLIQQAENTLKKAREISEVFLSSSSIMLDYISQFLLNDSAIQSLIHPAIHTLIHEDTCQTGGYYIETLRVYLYFGGNCTAASKFLHIHRNTLISRLEKIQSITGLVLDDPYVREVLQLSLLLALPFTS